MFSPNWSIALWAEVQGFNYEVGISLPLAYFDPPSMDFCLLGET